MKKRHWLKLALLGLLIALLLLACRLTPPTSPVSPISPLPESVLATPAPDEPTGPTPTVTLAPSWTPTPDADAESEVFLPAIIAQDPTPTPTPTPPPTATPMPTATPLPPPVPKPSFGVQIDPNTDDLSQVLRWVEGMGFGWIKVQVEWMYVEYEPEIYRWDALDRLVRLSNEFEMDLLIGVVDAPEWLRADPGYNGPPQDPAEFGRFMSVMAERYAGRVTAYELWNEPNLSREWYGATLDPAAFVTLVAHGSWAVRAADPEAIIVSGAPGVTGIDDGVDAIDDRRFLREMLAAGLPQWVDAIGVHPYGYGNPPQERAADATHLRSAWNEHPSFFFLDTLEDYHAILTEAGVDLPLWPTEFGWAAADGIRATNLPPDFPYPYAAWISEQEQADYLITACKLLRERPWIGPFFIWNLNMSVVWGRERPEALFSLLRPDTSYRPAYIALRVHQP